MDAKPCGAGTQAALFLIVALRFDHVLFNRCQFSALDTPTHNRLNGRLDNTPHFERNAAVRWLMKTLIVILLLTITLAIWLDSPNRPSVAPTQHSSYSAALQPTAPPATFGQFDSIENRMGSKKLLTKNEQWETGGRLFLLWPMVLVAGLALWNGAWQLAIFPLLLLRLIMTSFVFRLFLSMLAHIVNVAIFGAVAFTAYATWNHIRLWEIAVVGIAGFGMSAIFRRINLNLRLLGSAVAEESSVAGRLKFVKAGREALELVKPIWIERYLMGEQAELEMIRKRIEAPQSEPVISPSKPSD